MRVHVDEPRQHELAGRVDLVGAPHRRVDRHDATADDADVGADGTTSGAVDDGAAPDGELGVGGHGTSGAAGTSNP